MLDDASSELSSVPGIGSTTDAYTIPSLARMLDDAGSVLKEFPKHKGPHTQSNQ